ncbi:CBS domain-containing protein [Pseudoalteromonas xiamenensis]|uniref:CBS domain-containing protein n=1 Tax=Pseudoalteromonas xiamenensis TaxID=882626 RepID=A0A975DEI9_9GAMM|nr:CBS domain-containing protein [Pseudoalteromonas xiamenensis]QTH70109.1 CBS domain-containing protein [Pseudoalteromonas xiamenensis]QTH71439.1 CBS domain-containing protein [Pseudoalteromonas xiamenensis]WMN59822.1 CBS domain-containing protein [Pseudoalteromonas xiamenensis]
MGEYRAIKTIKLDEVFQFCDHYDSEPLSLSSSALKVVTDFTRRQPQVIMKDVDVDHALYMMINGHVRSKLVIDHDDTFLGVITAKDLTGRKVLATAQKKSLGRADLTVEDMMTKRFELQAMPYRLVESAKIGDVVETLQDIGQQHVLLVDDKGALRGMISASDIARALHMPVNILEKARSFKSIFEIIHDREELDA